MKNGIFVIANSNVRFSGVEDEEIDDLLHELKKEGEENLEPEDYPIVGVKRGEVAKFYRYGGAPGSDEDMEKAVLHSFTFLNGFLGCSRIEIGAKESTWNAVDDSEMIMTRVIVYDGSSTKVVDIC